jgi:hypothetical protein
VQGHIYSDRAGGILLQKKTFFVLLMANFWKKWLASGARGFILEALTIAGVAQW